MKRIRQFESFNADNVALTNYSTGVNMTYGQFAIGITNIHCLLFRNGIGKNDYVLITNEGTSSWAVELAGTVTYGAIAVVVPDNLSKSEREQIINQTSSKLDYDSIDNIESLISTQTLRHVDIDIFDFSLDDDIIMVYSRNGFGMLQSETIKVNKFMQLAEDIKTRYSSLRHSRIPSMLLANNNSIDAAEILASLSIGAQITLAGISPSSGTLLRCLKKCRPHFVYLDIKTAEKMIRERIFPLIYSSETSAYMLSSHTRRTMLKQVRKRMMFAFGGCIMIVSVTGGKFSPDVDVLLQKIDFPYQLI